MPPDLETRRHQRYVDTTLVIDGYRFEECTFIRVKFIYEGQKPFLFFGCHLEDYSMFLGSTAKEVIALLVNWLDPVEFARLADSLRTTPLLLN